MSSLTKPVISIMGPTASGKTTVAWQLATAALELAECPWQRVDIISADSRQVFQGLEIISGADIPADYEQVSAPGLPYPFVSSNQIFVHGVSILAPDESWSLAQFQQFAHQVIRFSWEHNGLPIVVGGTGLYHRHLCNPAVQVGPGADSELRSQLQEKTVAELQSLLKEESAQAWSALNQADQQNPRRLIRAIEKSRYQEQPPSIPAKLDWTFVEPDSWVKVAVASDSDQLAAKIEQRVQDRFQAGALAEASKLQAAIGFPSSLPIASATGYGELAAYLRQEIDLQTALARWQRREVQYAKRQLTWLGTEPGVKWIEAPESDQLSAAVVSDILAL